MALLEGGVEVWMEVRPRTLAHKSLCGSGVLYGFEVVLFPSLPQNAFLPFYDEPGQGMDAHRHAAYTRRARPSQAPRSLRLVGHTRPGPAWGMGPDGYHGVWSNSLT